MVSVTMVDTTTCETNLFHDGPLTRSLHHARFVGFKEPDLFELCSCLSQIVSGRLKFMGASYHVPSAHGARPNPMDDVLTRMSANMLGIETRRR